MNWSNSWGKTDPSTLNWSSPPPATDKPPISIRQITEYNIGQDQAIKPSDLASGPVYIKSLADMSQDELLMLWQAKKDALTKAKEDEMDLRKYIVTRAFPAKVEGTNTADLGNGYTLKAQIKFNYKLSDNDTVEKTLDKITAIGNQGAFIAERLVSWTPNFLLTEYRNLVEAASSSHEAQEILAAVGEMLVIDDAAPTLEIKTPKEKKK